YVEDGSTAQLFAKLPGGFDDYGVAVDGSIAAVAGNGYGLRFVDVSNPLAPKTVSTLSGTFGGVALANQYAYGLKVIPGNPSHTDMLVLDLSNPASPSVVGQLNIIVGREVRISGTLAYVASGSLGLQVVDIGNPASLHIVGMVDTPFNAAAVALGQGYVY